MDGVMQMAEKNKYTPMMQHYLQMKKENPDAIIFYRLGDFMRCFLMTRRLRRWSSTLC